MSSNIYAQLDDWNVEWIQAPDGDFGEFSSADGNGEPHPPAPLPRRVSPPDNYFSRWCAELVSLPALLIHCGSSHRPPTPQMYWRRSGANLLQESRTKGEITAAVSHRTL